MRSDLTAHPTMDALCDYRDHVGSGGAHDPLLADHLTTCDDCRETLTFLTSVASAAAQLPAPPATDALRARVLAAAAAASPASTGAPTMPVRLHTTVPARQRRRWVSATALAAALGVVTLGSFLVDTPEVQAGANAGSMELSTATPRAGDTITVRYTPGVSLGRFRSLRLRARVRTAGSESYTANIPVVTLDTLESQRDGSYRGSFVLADSLVYAALAVEDTAATEIDDRNGRTWEVMRAGRDGKALLTALEQRAGDHMGRSWEEIFATAKQMVAAYPDSVAAWSYLATTHHWMALSPDSIRALHTERVRLFDRQLRMSEHPSADDMGRMYWYARSMDSTIASYWEKRLRTQAPANTFIVQNRLIDVLENLSKHRDSSAALRALEPIWADAPDDRRAQIVSYATRIAVDSRDTIALRRWTDRVLALAASPSPRLARTSTVRSVALDFARVPALRAEGLQRLRDELRLLRGPAPLMRSLAESASAYSARVDRVIRATYSALGRTLVLDGQHRAALDTLRIAARQGWDTDVFRAVRIEALAVGDTAAALDVSARLSIDPRTSKERAALLDSFGIAALGTAPWQQRLASARRDFVETKLNAFRPRTIARAVPVTSLDGVASDLRTSLKGQVTVVAFLSRFCGPAIDALPLLQEVTKRLGESGVRTIAIYDESKPSTELTAFLTKHKVTLPVLLDSEKAASNTFNQWGTPYFYVVDERGRIMSEPTSDVDALLVNAEAVRLSGAR